jgi:3-oxoacyl-(acyl-carrier-protein) synthase III
MSVGIVAVGRFVPDGIMTNETVSQLSDTTPEWLIGAANMHERRYALPHQATSDLAIAAVQDLVNRYPDALRGVVAVIVATSTPDKPQPATATIVLDAIGIENAFAFDVNAVCAGSVFAMEIAAGIIDRAGADARVLVIGADRYSNIIDQSDRRTLAILGDGAGAVVLGKVPVGYGILQSKHFTDGEYQETVQVRGGGSRFPLTAQTLDAGDHYFRMDGGVVRDYVEENLPESIRQVVADSGLTMDEVSRFILHQANPKLLRKLAATLDIPESRVPITGDMYGNSGAASILVTLAESGIREEYKRDEVLVLGAVGGGLSTGVMSLRWY